jgi:hypothetical protein
MFSRSHEERLRRLARNLEKLAEKDRERIKADEEFLALRQAAASELHQLLADFVAEVNALVTEVKLDLSPVRWLAGSLNYNEPNIFQINVSGRVIQVSFQVTDKLRERVEIRTDYTLVGSVRWFNQELLEREEVREDRLYYCVGRTDRGWRFVDARSQKMGVFGADYLAGLLEQLVG